MTLSLFSLLLSLVEVPRIHELPMTVSLFSLLLSLVEVPRIHEDRGVLGTGDADHDRDVARLVEGAWRLPLLYDVGGRPVGKRQGRTCALVTVCA